MGQSKTSNSIPQQATFNQFLVAGDFRLAKIKDTDAERSTDDLRILRHLITENQPMYPNIDRWFDQKVLPGLKSSERIAWVAYEGENAIASAVLKLGRKSKFCHLRIHRDFQDLDLGRMFFSQMTFDARNLAKQIHFTLPESLWCKKSGFFESFGFNRAEKASRQYRRGDVELVCSAPLNVVWSAVLKKLPSLRQKFSVSGYSLNNEILVSIKPEYAHQILSGEKLVEVRRRFSDRWAGSRAVLYASSPEKALIGEATIRSVTTGHPHEIWARFGSSIGCSSAQFEEYVGSAGKVSAIELEGATPYREPIGLAQLSYLVQEDLRPPQSFCDLRLDDDESAWAKAVSVASLLHGGVTRTGKAYSGLSMFE
jgi:predicted transcriptional regulator/N-acetylglutamate synthase-like GNAT family acetyltransferase